MALVVLVLLGRHRFPFAAAVANWLLGVAVSFVDGQHARRARTGLAIVVCGAAIVVYHNPGHPRGQLFYIPMLFAIVWCAGLALRERAGHAEAAEQRALRAEREQVAAARVATAEERALIAREPARHHRPRGQRHGPPGRCCSAQAHRSGLNISAYRIVQEGLTNVLKHADASAAVVWLHYAPTELSIDVQDNGRGMAPGGGHHPGHGLIGIRERVRLYDGEMTTSAPADGAGFLLRVRLPLNGRPR